MCDEYKKMFSWSFEKALSEQEKWDKIGNHPEYARGPFFRWVDAQKLDELKKSYEAGNKSEILWVIYYCALNDFVIPQWCALEYLKSFRSVIGYKVGSLDDAFGKPHPKGTHLGAKQQQREKKWAVYFRIKNLNENEGWPIDGHIFETVGLEFGIGGKTTREKLYYEAKKHFDNI